MKKRVCVWGNTYFGWLRWKRWLHDGGVGILQILIWNLGCKKEWEETQQWSLSEALCFPFSCSSCANLCNELAWKATRPTRRPSPQSPVLQMRQAKGPDPEAPRSGPASGGPRNFIWRILTSKQIVGLWPLWANLRFLDFEWIQDFHVDLENGSKVFM